MFVDISDPVAPLYLGRLPNASTEESVWRDIKVYDNHAYVVSEAPDHGLQVFDLTRLRGVVTPQTFSADALYSGFATSHNMVIDETSGFGFAVGTDTCNGGLHMLDLRTPPGVSFAGCFSGDGYIHDAQCLTYDGPDSSYRGREICLALNPVADTLTIVDVTDKNAVAVVSRSGYAGSVFTHQGWLTSDRAYFLVNDEGDETTNGHNTRTYVWDVSNLAAPELVGAHTHAVAAIDHNLYVRWNYAFESNFRAGLRILALTDLTQAKPDGGGLF